MIPSLKYSSISFGANEPASPRESYESHLGKIAQTAQRQNRIVEQPNPNPAPIKPIPMQGTGQKLDCMA